MLDTPSSKKRRTVGEDAVTPCQDLALEEDTTRNDERNKNNATKSSLHDSLPKLQSSVSPLDFKKTVTPRKLIIGPSENKYALSQPTTSASSSLQVPALQQKLVPLSQDSRGRRIKMYSQSPPRSPGRSPNRSPVRKLELIQLSPIKNSRLELQKLYDAHNAKIGKMNRLYIHKLVLHNFKSYAGEQTIGPFDASFSAVVGPNGSGKSNVIDSMLFVFGFRANKMRQDRLSDLIHKSERFTNLNFCSVEVHFRYVKDEYTAPTDGDTMEAENTLVITRKAFKNNSSKYFINGKESNFTEVTKLLKEQGIDLDHKRFLILQGEVENIAQMKAKAEKDNEDGLLEYLEDIIGTKHYKPLIEQKTVEIEAMNELCIEKENRFRIVDDEKNSLEKDKDAALEFLEKEKQLTLLKSKLTQYHLYVNNDKIKTTLGQIDSLRTDFEQEKQRHSQFMKEVETLQNSIDESKNNLTSLTTEEKSLIQRKREINTQSVSLEETTKNLDQKLKKAKATVESSKSLISKNEHELQEQSQLQEEYEAEVNDLSKQREVEEKILLDIKLQLKDKTVTFSDEIASIEKELEPSNTEIQEKKSQIKLVEMEIDLIRDSKRKVGAEIESLKEELLKLQKDLEDNEKDVTDLNKSKRNLVKEKQEGDKECKDAGVKLNEMKAILNSHRQKTMEARSTVSTAQNKNKVLTSLMRMQQSGRINGFHGRLGDLGIIADQYDVAISTACPRLDDMVVESVECGQTCIEFLRKNKLGYARFVVLDKLKRFDMSPIQTPENVPRLFDLVKPKEKRFAPAIYSVLRDTLVAKDLKQANRVAYGKRRFRVVTLDGQLIDISGTMSGGGSRVFKGLMNLTTKVSGTSEIFSLEDMKKLEMELAAREKQFDVASETFHSMEQELRKLCDREPQLELEISKKLIDIDALTQQIQLTRSQLTEKSNDYEKSIKDTDDLDLLLGNLEALNQELKYLQDQSKTSSERVSFLKDEIMRIGGSELQLQNSKVSSLNQRIDILQAKLKKSKTVVKKLNTELKKARKSLIASTEESTNSTEEIAHAKARAEVAKNSLLDINKSLESIQDEKINLEQELENFSDKLHESNENVNEFKTIQLELENKIERANSILSYLKKENGQLLEELNNFRLRDVTHTLDLLREEEGTEANQQPTTGTDETTSNVDNEMLGAADAGVENMNTSSLSNSVKVASDEISMDVDDCGDLVSQGIPRLSDKELSTIDTDNLNEEINQLQSFINNVSINIEILEEYAKRLVEFKKRKIDLNNSVGERNQLTSIMEELKKKRYNEFMEGFSIISMTLKEMYQMITMGGNAELELVDSLDPFSEGVTFSVMPPKKSWRNITNLSGGEKTLSSLALVFALHKYKPTPLYVMDEIDAALDFRNVSIVANYIKERTKNAQFIVISLRNNMFELAKQLVGIYKHENMTKNATIRNREDLIQ
ncbi:condensin subunit SMC4 KNAG_0G02020 [Huiozyma naganishii CBS 8797]|uniref:Structural maintenance of chromosomes protein n=1 Tax=Huiozyma naganishii (strain ATCC MYA-139 / BCRC 22969 / CBS 8797 / KCTC 17520 / NBRC 10181 / NCYC 3082 / Yp74L-3) TaxID=1071383 RepID=J7S7Z3_HUIN7|nr:hypothetical protein KNAG_0G02020 [Kazachstania naganishii CBS 8797]CCK71259.1 hypothetical protein KNAG_0G02020 [Kazachstania naganishii CBS 8797]